MSRLMILASLLLVALVAFLVVLWATQRRLIYFPFGEVSDPAALGLTDVDAVTFETADGLRLGGWFFPARSAPRAAVLVFNGNAGNRVHRVPLAEALRRRGLQVFLVDYRGYGGNAGAPSEEGLAVDARAARSHLAARPGVNPARIIYFGESLGAAVAVELATEHPPAALVLRSPFTSMADIGQHHYPWLPVRWLLRDRYASIQRIGRLRSPLLVVAGERDRVVPIEYSRRLYEAAAGRKALFVLPDADHNDMELLAGDAMITAIAGFLDASLSGDGGLLGPG
jgi:fermentation-respiration switch protein FrsA (DUF1100 family)